MTVELEMLPTILEIDGESSSPTKLSLYLERVGFCYIAKYSATALYAFDPL